MQKAKKQAGKEDPVLLEMFNIPSEQHPISKVGPLKMALWMFAVFGVVASVLSAIHYLKLL